MMERALAQARLGLDEGAMPIGAVLARNGDVVAEAHWKGFEEGLLGHPEHEVLLEGDRRPPGSSGASPLSTRRWNRA